MTEEISTRGTAPPLNEYKVEFAKGRILRTVLGGVDYLAKGSIPSSVHIFQTTLFLLPAAFGIAASVIIDQLSVTSWILEIITGGTTYYLIPYSPTLSVNEFGGSKCSVVKSKNEKQSFYICRYSSTVSHVC